MSMFLLHLLVVNAMNSGIFWHTFYGTGYDFGSFFMGQGKGAKGSLPSHVTPLSWKKA